MNKANRTASGALSHKNDDKTVWACVFPPPFCPGCRFAHSDGIHMISVPLSSIGLARQRIDLLTLNYEQIVLYRQALFNTTYQLWEHIRNDNATADNDPRIWATGALFRLPWSCSLMHKYRQRLGSFGHHPPQGRHHQI